MYLHSTTERLGYFIQLLFQRPNFSDISMNDHLPIGGALARRREGAVTLLDVHDIFLLYKLEQSTGIVDCLGAVTELIYQVKDDKVHSNEAILTDCPLRT
jgi:hypothetical protein